MRALSLDGDVVSIRCESCAASLTLGSVGAPRLRLVEDQRGPSSPATWVVENSPNSQSSQFELDVPVELDANDTTVPQTHCPKCVAPRVGATCSQCGLDFEHGQADALPDWLVTEWGRIVKDWKWIERHLRLLDRAARVGALWGVARLYRLYLVRNPGDPIALQVCQEVLDRAASTLVRSEQEEAASQKSRWRALGIMGLVAVLAVIALATLRGLV